MGPPETPALRRSHTWKATVPPEAQPSPPGHTQPHAACTARPGCPAGSWQPRLRDVRFREGTIWTRSLPGATLSISCCPRHSRLGTAPWGTTLVPCLWSVCPTPSHGGSHGASSQRGCHTRLPVCFLVHHDTRVGTVMRMPACSRAIVGIQGTGTHTHTLPHAHGCIVGIQSTRTGTRTHSRARGHSCAQGALPDTPPQLSLPVLGYSQPPALSEIVCACLAVRSLSNISVP